MVNGNTTVGNNLTVSGSAAGTSVVMMRGLPTSDPSNVGQLWNDGGTLSLSIIINLILY